MSLSLKAEFNALKSGLLEAPGQIYLVFNPASRSKPAYARVIEDGHEAIRIFTDAVTASGDKIDMPGAVLKWAGRREDFIESIDGKPLSRAPRPADKSLN